MRVKTTTQKGPVRSVNGRLFGNSLIKTELSEAKPPVTVTMIKHLYKIINKLGVR